MTAAALDAQQSPEHRGRGENDRFGPNSARVGAENLVTSRKAQMHPDEAIKGAFSERSAMDVAGGGVQPPGGG